MEFLTQLITTISGLDRKKLHLYLGVTLGGISLCTFGLWYTLHTRRNTQIEALKQLHDQSQKNDLIIRKSEHIKKEEDRVQLLLDENRGFSIKTFFEEFCREHGLQAEAGWGSETRSIEGSETFDEVLLSTTFTKQTTQSLVALLSSLDNNEIVYIKELEVKREGASHIGCNLTIATKKRKQFWDE